MSNDRAVTIGDSTHIGYSLDRVLGLSRSCYLECVCAKCFWRRSQYPDCECKDHGVCGLTPDRIVARCPDFKKIPRNVKVKTNARKLKNSSV